MFYGPPGLGKTTLSGIIANEMGTHAEGDQSGPAIEKPGEMAAILNNLQEGDVLFVDEIHRLNRQVEEVLYPAMEDFAIDIMIGKGAVGQIHPSGSAQVYTGRSHHQGRPFIGTFTGPFWGGASIWSFTRQQELATIVHSFCTGTWVWKLIRKGAAEIAKTIQGYSPSC